MLLLKDLRFQLQLYALKIIPKLKNKSNAVVSPLHLKREVLGFNSSYDQ